MHIEDIVDRRGFIPAFRLHAGVWLIERINLDSRPINDRRHQRFGAATGTADRQHPNFTLSLDNSRVVERIRLLTHGTLVEHRDYGTPNIEFVRFHHIFNRECINCLAVFQSPRSRAN